MKLSPATLTLGSGGTAGVLAEHQLSNLLASLDVFQDGQVVLLERGQPDFIKATKQGSNWSVIVKRGKMWIAQSFTAGMTTDYGEQRAQANRNHKSFREQLLWWLRSPPPERALSTKQVKTLFAEYLSGKAFTLPISGA